MADETYQPKTYREQGGDRFVVASGGSLDVESGGEIDIESSGALKFDGTAIAATADEINNLENADKIEKVIKIPLATGEGQAGALQWQNVEESADIIITKLIVHITGASTATCTLDFGVAATATGTVNTLIDPVDSSATGVTSSIPEANSGAGPQICVDDAWVLGGVVTGINIATVGNAYIHYVIV